VNSRLFVLLVVLCACTAARAPESARPARWDSAADLLPADLDVVVRIGWARLRASPLYGIAAQSLPERAGTVALGAALERARTVVVGARVMPDGLHGDGVLAIETEETDLEPATIRHVLGADALAPRALPGGIVVHEAGSTPGRTDPALLIVAPRTGLVLATAGEADAVLRVAREGPSAGKLEPPARGLVSFAIRAPRGSGWVTASGDRAALKSLTEGLETARGTLDLADDGVELSAEIRYGEAALAASAAARVREMIDTLAGGTGPWAEAARRWKSSMALSVDDAAVSVSMTIPFALLARRR
jgi:hypothetical protein